MTARANKLTERARSSDPGIPAGVINVFVNALQRLGYDTDSLLANAGVVRSDLNNPDGSVSCRAMGTIMGAAMKERPLRNLGVRLAAETPIGAFPLVDYLVLTSETVGLGLHQLARYLRLAGAPYTLEPLLDEDPIRVLYANTPEPFTAEFGVTLTLLHLREETDGRLKVAYASFPHSPEDVAEIEQILDCPIRTNSSWTGFALSPDAWEIPLRRRDPILRSVLERHAAGIAARIPTTDALALEVRRVLASRMAKGNTQIQEVARALATSTRSLQRRLASAGLSFQQLVDLTRREAAGEYLSNPSLSIGEVAYLLGYSEPAAFHRAFKRWNGATPQSFRHR